MQILKYIFMVLTIVQLVAAGNVLTAKPAFLNPCKITDPDFSSCFCKNFVGILTVWKSGVPGLKNVAFEPLKIKRMTFGTGTNGPSVNLEHKDVNLHWLDGITCSNASFDPKTLALRINLNAFKVKFNADYELKGRILSFVLDAKGKITGGYETMELALGLKFKLREKGGYSFTEVDKTRFVIGKVTGGHFHLDNLFNDDKALADSANAIINASWEPLFDVGRPDLNRALNAIIKDRMSKMFAYVPASYLFEELPDV